MIHYTPERFIKEMFLVIVLDSWVAIENFNITFDLLKLQQSGKKWTHWWGPRLNKMCQPAFASQRSQIKSRLSLRWKKPVVVWFLRWTVRCCDFKRVGERLFPEQSRSWLRHSNPCAPNRTAVLSARGYNQGNTSKFSLWSRFAHMHAYNMAPCINRSTFIEPLANCTWILCSMTHNGSAIRSLSLALNQT